MKVAILAGGMGTRLSEETVTKPKPMVEIGGKPILWHIMKIYSHYGFNDFVIALGYKGKVIKDYFFNYAFYNARATSIDFANRIFTVPSVDDGVEKWKITFLETGLHTQTGGRIKQILDHVQEPVMLTYGDGVANIDINKLLQFHAQHNVSATVTGVLQPPRFGIIRLNTEDSNLVARFDEKPYHSPVGDFINGGFFVLDPSILDCFPKRYVDETNFEADVLPILANKNRLGCYLHLGFWQCMDTPRDVKYLNELWATKKAGWKVWDD